MHDEPPHALNHGTQDRESRVRPRREESVLVRVRLARERSGASAAEQGGGTRAEEAEGVTEITSAARGEVRHAVGGEGDQPVPAGRIGERVRHDAPEGGMEHGVLGRGQRNRWVHARRDTCRRAVRPSYR